MGRSLALAINFSGHNIAFIFKFWNIAHIEKTLYKMYTDLNNDSKIDIGIESK